MEFLKELFNGGALTYDQLTAAVKGIRFPNDVVEAVEQAIQGKNCTFSAFVIAAVRAALEDLTQPDA